MGDHVIDPFDEIDRIWFPKEIPADSPLYIPEMPTDVWSGTRDTDRRM